MTLRELIEGGAQAALDRVADVGSLIRYGVPFNEKARLALTGAIPGADRANLRGERGYDAMRARPPAGPSTTRVR